MARRSSAGLPVGIAIIRGGGRDADKGDMDVKGLLAAIAKVFVFLGIGVLVYNPGTSMNHPQYEVNTTETGSTAWDTDNWDWDFWDCI
eukprot:596165-Prymnesium_polylepis.1